MNNTYDSEMEKKLFYKKIFALVLPMALQNIINVGVTAADVLMLGKVGETVLSASSLASQIQFILTLIIFGLTSGAAVLTAQYWGKRDVYAIQKIIGITLRFTIVISLIFSFAAITIPTSLMKVYTSEPAVIAEGVKFLRIIGFSYLLSSVTMTYLNIMRSVERVIVSTIVYSISLATTILLNSILIFGLFGFPQLGIVGAAIGNLCARIVEIIIVFIYAKKNKAIPFSPKYIFVRDKLLFKDFIVYSVPVVINEMLWGLGVSTNTAILGHLGSPVIAANSVAQVTRQLATVVCFGIANAAAIVIGKAIGENKLDAAKIYAKRLLRLSVIFGICGGALILLCRPVILSYMNLSEEACRDLTVMLIVMSYFVVCQAYNCTSVVGILRGGGDTKFGLVIDVSSMWGFSILLGAVAAFVLKWPVPIVYMILMSDEIVKIPLSTWRYRSFRWLKNVTR